MSQPVDATLIAQLFDRYASILELYAAQRTTAPEDCVQEAFLELARQHQAPADAVAWLFRVVRNRALNAARAAYRRQNHEQAAAEQRALQDVKDDPNASTTILDLLQILTDRQREVVVLRIWGQLSWDEIASVTNRSRSAAHRDYIDALSKLRIHLEPTSCPVEKRTGS